MRTLVISDLHLGSLLGRDVLRRPAALGALEAQVAKADRLVLLGDVLELLDERPSEALSAARHVLPVLAAALGREGEIVVVPGNHDHALVRSWLRERLGGGAPLTPTTRVPRRASPLLADLCSLLRPARVQVRYPGLWLQPRTYATHGHYVDRHLLAALRGRPEADDGDGDGDGTGEPSATVADYERSLGIDTGAIQELLATTLPAPLSALTAGAVGRARRAMLSSVPLIGAAPGMRGASMLWATVLEYGIHRRGAIPAIARVARDLGISADAIVFGHIHRRGPLAGDDPAIWRPRGGGGPRLLNCGSWVWDPALVHRGGASRPYRPGGAVVIDGKRAPRSLDVLADVPSRALRSRR